MTRRQRRETTDDTLLRAIGLVGGLGIVIALVFVAIIILTALGYIGMRGGQARGPILEVVK